jgi:hypothetical protein
MANYLTRKQVSEIYPISFSSLAHMASKGVGIPYRIVGKSAIYRRDQVEQWIEEQEVDLEPRRKSKRRGRPRKIERRETTSGQSGA